MEAKKFHQINPYMMYLFEPLMTCTISWYTINVICNLPWPRKLKNVIFKSKWIFVLEFDHLFLLYIQVFNKTTIELWLLTISCMEDTRLEKCITGVLSSSFLNFFLPSSPSLIKGAEANLYTFRYCLFSESIQICFRTLYHYDLKYFCFLLRKP